MNKEPILRINNLTNGSKYLLTYLFNQNTTNFDVFPVSLSVTQYILGFSEEPDKNRKGNFPGGGPRTCGSYTI